MSGIARAFLSGQLSLLEGQNEEENEKSFMENKKKMIEILGKNEESGTIVHLDLWGWLWHW